MSIARALAKKPQIILGDEPTGALDSETGVIVLELLQKLGKEHGNTVVIASADNRNTEKNAPKFFLKSRSILRNSITTPPPLPEADSH